MSEPVVIEIPMMPPRECSPNWHGHWRRRARHAAKFRETAGWATLAVMGCPVCCDAQWDGKQAILDIEVEWCCRRKAMDDDNVIAACKPARDGVADKLFHGDDKQIRVGTVTQTRGRGLTRFVLREVEA